MNLSNFDLNLLKTLLVLLQTPNTNKAAEVLGTSQPAVSRHLARLRDELHDPLFVRHPKGLKLTPKAEELAKTLPKLLSDLELQLTTSIFDPSRLNGTLKIALNGFVVETHGHKLFKEIHKQAPNLGVEIYSYNNDTANDLIAGKLDFAINFFPINVSKELRQTRVGTMHFVGICRADHPNANQHLSLAEFVNLDVAGLIIPKFNAREMVINSLSNNNVDIKPRLRCEHINPILNEVRQSELIFIAPKSLLDVLSPNEFSYLQVDVGASQTKMDVALIYNSRFTRSEKFKWLEKICDDILPTTQ